jgi:hypothetical protein
MFCYTGSSKANTSIIPTCEVLCGKVAAIRKDWKGVTVDDLRIQQVTLPFILNSDMVFPIWCMFFMHCSVHKIPFCAISSAKKDLDDLRYALIWSIMNRKSLAVDKGDMMSLSKCNVDMKPLDPDTPISKNEEEVSSTLSNVMSLMSSGTQKRKPSTELNALSAEISDEDTPMCETEEEDTRESDASWRAQQRRGTRMVVGRTMRSNASTQLRSLSDVRRDAMWSIYCPHSQVDLDKTDTVFRTAVQYIEEKIIGLPRPEYRGACIMLTMYEWPNILYRWQKSEDWTQAKKLPFKEFGNLSIKDNKVRTCFVCCHFE